MRKRKLLPSCRNCKKVPLLDNKCKLVACNFSTRGVPFPMSSSISTAMSTTSPTLTAISLSNAFNADLAGLREVPASALPGRCPGTAQKIQQVEKGVA
eukprot:2778851-Amphidinium_carterae.1